MKALEIEVEECSDYPPDIDLNPKKQREEMSEKSKLAFLPHSVAACGRNVHSKNYSRDGRKLESAKGKEHFSATEDRE